MKGSDYLADQFKSALTVFDGAFFKRYRWRLIGTDSEGASAVGPVLFLLMPSSGVSRVSREAFPPVVRSFDTRPLARALLRMRRGPGRRAGRRQLMSLYRAPLV